MRGISKKYFNLLSGKECYRLLIYLTQFFNNNTLIDLGTSNGASALALSTNNSNLIFSFDIRDRTQIILTQGDSNPAPYSNRIDFITTYDFTRYLDLILASPLIYLDIAHDGIWERKLFNLLTKHKYKGIMICDDINDFPELKKFWDEIEIKKYNITKYGHFSGTGLVDFGGNLELILE